MLSLLVLVLCRKGFLSFLLNQQQLVKDMVAVAGDMTISPHQFSAVASSEGGFLKKKG